MFNMDSKAMQMMLSTVIKSLGIDGPSLLENINKFQGWVVHAIQHHDARLQALEVENKAISAKLDALLNHHGVVIESAPQTGESDNGSNQLAG
jgi:hypothetical protein